MNPTTPSSEKKTSILVTGGAGFIGSHACERLVGSGHAVICLDNFDEYYNPHWKRENIQGCLSDPSFRLIEGSILDVDLVDSIFEGHTPQIVLHLAARAGVRPSLLNPKAYEETNGRGTLNILEACRKYKTPHCVYTSSSSVYGFRRDMPLAETDAITNPVSPYGAAKYASEKICQVYQSLTGMSLNVIRPFTVYGPRQRPDMAINKFVKAIDEERKVPLFGDGSTARDYTYISDFIDGLEKALFYRKGFQIFNLGGSRSTPLLDLVRTISECLGKKAQIEFLPEQPGDVPLTLADVSHAKALLGYNPQVEIREGIANFVEWRKRLSSVGRA